MTDSLRERLQATLGDGLTIERELGGGGMSRVFLAEDTTLRRRVVVKVLPPELAAEVSVARFQREIALAARLQHPHIVPLIATGAAGELPWYTMPFVDGESLRERLAHDGELPVPEAVRLLRELASALAYAHSMGIVHRDIKPENILLTGGIALVTDFGVAKALSDATTVGRGALTTAGVAIGTPAYMSPEQVSADPGIDHRSDVYSFGVVAYEMLTGQPPFAGRTTQALLAAHVVEAPESLAVRRPAVPPALTALVMRCLEKRQADRPQDAGEIVRALDALATPTSSAVRATPRRLPRARLLAVVLAAIVVAGGAWFAFARRARSADVASARVLIAPFENLTGDPRFNHIGRIAADRLALMIAQVGSIDVVPSNTVIMTLRDTAGGMADRVQRLSQATHAGLLVSGSVMLRGDSLVLQAQVSDVRSGRVVVTLEPASGSAADPVAAVDSLGDRLLGALGRRRNLTALPQGFRAPKYAAYQEFAAGFERFAQGGDNMGSRPFLERAIAIDPGYVQAYVLLTRQYLDAGEYARADSLLQRIDRLPGGLTAAERLLRDYERAELEGNLPHLLRAAQQLAARDSSGIALLIFGGAATMLLQPRSAVPALEQAAPMLALIGGEAERVHAAILAEAYHQQGAHDRELRTWVVTEATFSRSSRLRGGKLRAYAGLRQGATALAVADSMLRDRDDSTGGSAYSVTRAAQEFRSHGGPVTATRLLAMAVEWYRREPVREPLANRRFHEGIAMLMSGMADSAAVRFAWVARDTSRIDAAGYLALADVARGQGARARAIADSLGTLRRRWLFGTHTFWRASIVGALGDRALAVQLLRQATGEGRHMDTWHYATELDSLHGYPPFEALIRPQR